MFLKTLNEDDLQYKKTQKPERWRFSAKISKQELQKENSAQLSLCSAWLSWSIYIN
jgi:hypothetical protein